MNQIKKIKNRLGNDVADSLIETLLEDAEAEILDYCNREVLLPKMEGLQRELAITYYNRMGSEGEASRSEGGISVSYSTEMPESIRLRLSSYRRLKAVGVANANKE